MIARDLLGRLMRGVAVAGAVGLILLAVGAGVLRLVIIQLPGYQDDIREWVRSELAINLDFSRMDVRWSLLGPEFSFLNAAVSRDGGEAKPFLSAVEVTVTLSMPALISERRLEVARLTLEGSNLRIERGGSAGPMLANLPGNGTAWAGIPLADIPPVTIVINDGTVTYADDIRQREWSFDDVRLRLVRELDGVVVEARANSPRDLAESIELSVLFDAEGWLQGRQPEWRVFGETRGLDLARLSDLLWEPLPLPASGVGDISFWADLAGGQAQQVTLALALEGLSVGEPDGGGPDYERVGVTLEGSRLRTGWALSASNLDLNRAGRPWPPGAAIDMRIGEDSAGLSSLSLRSSFMRLEDLTPLVTALPWSGIAGPWAELQPRGEARDVEVRLARGLGSWRYAVVGSVDDLHVASRGVWPGLRGFSGALRADSRSGRIDLDTRGAHVDWPVLFAGPLEVDEFSGRLTWRRGGSGLRISSDGLVINTPDGQTRSALELTWPHGDGNAPNVALQSEMRNLNAAGIKRYFPVGFFTQVTDYLGGAVLGGHIPSAEVTLIGPLAAFPFANGEGIFHAEGSVENGSMAYIENWPAAEDLNGVLTFTNAGWEATGGGRVLGNRSENLRVGIKDVRDPVLGVAATTQGTLGEALRFLKEVPMTSQRMGPDLQRVQSGGGTAETAFELSLPLTGQTNYRLEAELEIAGGELSIDGFGPTLTDISGVLRLADDEVASRGNLTASFLDAPVSIGVAAVAETGYIADIAFNGVFSAASLQAAFDLPFVEHIPGASAWQGHVLLPENRFVQARREPLRIDLATDLVGVGLSFPEPLKKSPEQEVPLDLKVVFSETDRININGRLGEARRFAFSYRNRGGELSFRRGAVRFGGAAPLLPSRDGLSVSGELASVDFDAWWTLLRRQILGGTAAGLLLGTELEIADFSAFGQSLGPTDVSLRQQVARWRLQVESERAAGVINWPLDLSDRPQILAEMDWLHLSADDMSADSSPDPRNLPGILVHVDNFSVGTRRLGAFDADIRADAQGLNIVSLRSRSESFLLEGSGGWYQRPERQETRLVLTASSEDVAGALEQLGFDPVAEAGSAQLALNVYWPSGPAPGWEDSIAGGLNLRLERGSILNLDPGAGRMMGLMSITALPRRLALDFRDVFNRGLVFDELSGDFVIVDGNAYTDNLRLAGPVVDIGVVGRTGLRDRDYQQYAVVTSEPGRILPAVGFLAGPQVAAALLLFSEIFKEPLNGATRASYCVTGSWSNPQVERQTAEQLEQNRLCADLPRLAVAVGL